MDIPKMIEQAFKEFSFKEHPFTEEEWNWYLNFHPAGLDTFRAGYEAALKDNNLACNKCFGDGFIPSENEAAWIKFGETQSCPICSAR